MGHAVGKDVYRKLGKKIDNLSTRAPWNDTFHAVLKELFSTEEADLFVKLPYTFSNLHSILKQTKYNPTKLKTALNKMASKGLVMDLWAHGEYHYLPSPLVVGIFECTMMRTGGNLNSKKWAELFHAYLNGTDSFWAENCRDGKKVSIIRALAHEEVIKNSDHLEIYDYEKATALIDSFDKFSIGLCSCRHEKLHAGVKECDTPLDTCSSFGVFADFMIRNNLAKQVSKSEMLENLARSKELGLVLEADNVKNRIAFMCHCDKCCCNPLLGIRKFGYANAVVTSNFIAEVEDDQCIGCGKCAQACPIEAIDMIPLAQPHAKFKKKKEQPEINNHICIGCGVCALQCKTKGVQLVPRGQRVITPETTFERVILQCLERGTLQNQLFDNPQSITQGFMRGVIGAFLNLSPVKKSLMSDTLRSSFLSMMTSGIQIKGKGWLTEL